MDLDRQHTRLPAGYRVYIEADSNDNEEPISVCQALDISRSGIRLQLDRELALGAFIHLGVEASGEAPLILVAVVRWCRPLEAANGGDATTHWLAGLELQPATGSDYESWFALLDTLEP